MIALLALGMAAAALVLSVGLLLWAAGVEVDRVVDRAARSWPRRPR